MNNKSQKFKLGEWIVDLESGNCVSDVLGTVRLEPKTSAVFAILIHAQGELVSKDEIIVQAWSGQFASDETLLRTISRLRSALHDDPKSPRFIETVPKRGYRLVEKAQLIDETASVQPVSGQPKRKWLYIVLAVLICAAVLAGWFIHTAKEQTAGRDLLTQADDFYHQMRLADNEMAISLYEQHIDLQPGAAAGYAGLANTLVQRAVRYTVAESEHYSSLTEKVEAGVLDNEEARNLLNRAHTLAVRAVEIQPNSAVTLKALGFVQSAQGKYEDAIETYERAIAIDDQAWQVWINLGELHGVSGNRQLAVSAFESAFQSMRARYEEQEVQIRPWIADIAAVIGTYYLEDQAYSQAETWFEDALRYAPLHESGTLGLAQVLYLTGDRLGGVELCQQLASRLQKEIRCEQLPETPAILH
ncbi:MULTISPECIES: winged helix-turn-helix domain-containing protein [Gammaproteobacteria]|uniref:winged helix-turn-helix domain-containing protein n=1 Tax=Gammaproteobacteria TaxID=1236 RepID=UPI000DD0B6A6|nr:MULTISPECIES: winged helix-turn-helix domain-containing protein [Gammaproteobacteria]RTE86563.1 tetratricopeptide repeat protein [Aliidiomarina sp. B3213]TCZ90882.1 tetratricopeptide repeat protein [Lysobacter sp. N42]